MPTAGKAVFRWVSMSKCPRAGDGDVRIASTIILSVARVKQDVLLPSWL